MVNDLTKGVKFGSYHSFSDFGLYLREWPEITPPEAKIISVDVEGMDGSIDLSDSLTGEVRFKNRTLSFSFSMFGDRERWPTIFSNIQNLIHGKRLQIILDNDPGYFYIGRIAVNKWEADMYRGYITIQADVEPYKYERFSSAEGNWLWDPFNFETGIIRNYKNIAVNGTMTMDITGLRKTVIPTFVVTSSSGITVKIERNGKTNQKTYTTGTYHDYEMSIYEGENTLTMSGNGTITIDYRGGSL